MTFYADDFFGRGATGGGEVFAWVPLVGSRWVAGGSANTPALIISVASAWDSPESNRFTCNADIDNANGSSEGYTWALDATDTLADLGVTVDEVMSGEVEILFYIRTNIAPTLQAIWTVAWSQSATAIDTNRAIGMKGDSAPIGDILPCVQSGANNTGNAVATSNSEAWDDGGVICALSIHGTAIVADSVLIPDAPTTQVRSSTSLPGDNNAVSFPTGTLYLVINAGKSGIGTHTVDTDISIWIAKRTGIQPVMPV